MGFFIFYFLEKWLKSNYVTIKKEIELEFSHAVVNFKFIISYTYWIILTYTLKIQFNKLKKKLINKCTN